MAKRNREADRAEREGAISPSSLKRLVNKTVHPAARRSALPASAFPGRKKRDKKSATKGGKKAVPAAVEEYAARKRKYYKQKPKQKELWELDIDSIISVRTRVATVPVGAHVTHKIKCVRGNVVERLRVELLWTSLTIRDPGDAFVDQASRL